MILSKRKPGLLTQLEEILFESKTYLICSHQAMFKSNTSYRGYHVNTICKNGC
jgi:hypothetical protein